MSPAFFVTRFLPVGFCMAFMFYFGNRAYLYDTHRLKRRTCLAGLTLFEGDLGRRMIVATLLGGAIGFERLAWRRLRWRRSRLLGAG